MNPFAADIGAAAPGAASNLVDLVQKHDPIFFNRADRLARDGVIIDQLVGLFINQRLVSVFHCCAHAFGASAHRFAQHVGQVDHPHRATAAGDIHHRHPAAARIGKLNIHGLVVQFAAAQLAPEDLAG